MSTKTFLLSSLSSLLFTFAVGCGGGTGDGDAIGNPAGTPTTSPPTTNTPPPSSSGSPSTPSSTSECAASEPCIEGDVTLTDGSTFHFARKAIMSKSEGAIGVRALDTKIPFGISIYFKPNALAEGQAYPSEVAGSVWMSVYREHPTESGKTRLSSAQFGNIVFAKTGATSAESAAGTFDGVAVVRNEPDDTVNIRLTNGKFRAGAL